MNVRIEIEMNVYADDMASASAFVTKAHDLLNQLYLEDRRIGKHLDPTAETLKIEATFI